VVARNEWQGSRSAGRPAAPKPRSTIRRMSFPVICSVVSLLVLRMVVRKSGVPASSLAMYSSMKASRSWRTGMSRRFPPFSSSRKQRWRPSHESARIRGHHTHFAS